MRVVALLTVRNEELFLDRCLRHLAEQGVETCVIDNDSTDRSRAIAESYRGRGVFAVERLPFAGFFDLVAQLRQKEALAREIDADWFIHHDADEIREAPAGLGTLAEAIARVDVEGYNAIDFDEFVFLPTLERDDFEGMDYVASMRHYYRFAPTSDRQIKAWKAAAGPAELASTGGHAVKLPDRRVYPRPFVLRHYIALGRRHAARKYGPGRVFSAAEIALGWHGRRPAFDPERVRWPRERELRCLDAGPLDRSDPWRVHRFLETAAAE